MAAPVAVRDLRLPVLVAAAAAAEGEASDPGESADGSRELPAFSLARALAGEAEVPPEAAAEVERRFLKVGMTCGEELCAGFKRYDAKKRGANSNPEYAAHETKSGLIYR